MKTTSVLVFSWVWDNVWCVLLNPGQHWKYPSWQSRRRTENTTAEPNQWKRVSHRRNRSEKHKLWESNFWREHCWGCNQPKRQVQRPRRSWLFQNKPLQSGFTQRSNKNVCGWMWEWTILHCWPCHRHGILGYVCFACLQKRETLSLKCVKGMQQKPHRALWQNLMRFGAFCLFHCRLLEGIAWVFLQSSFTTRQKIRHQQVRNWNSWQSQFQKWKQIGSFYLVISLRVFRLGLLRWVSLFLLRSSSSNFLTWISFLWIRATFSCSGILMRRPVLRTGGGRSRTFLCTVHQIQFGCQVSQRVWLYDQQEITKFPSASLFGAQNAVPPAPTSGCNLWLDGLPPPQISGSVPDLRCWNWKAWRTKYIRPHPTNPARVTC